MSTTPICPCGVLIHPAVIFNSPNLPVIRYRVGDYISFREALLRPRSGEVQLRLWRPGASGDLAVQMLEWWAYIADVLTFYNERIANQAYLGTADLPESVQRLIRILGYRPRPGIGATGFLAAIIDGAKPVLIPAGLPIQSKPAPGQDPQIFEVDATVTALPAQSSVPANPPPDQTIGSSVLLAGAVTGIVPAEQLLLVKRGWAGVQTDYALVTVKSAASEKDPRGALNTRVTFTAAAALPAGAQAQDFRLMRNAQTVGIWPYLASQALTANSANPASLARQIHVGDPVLVNVAGVQQLVTVKTYTELVWFTNPQDADHPDVPDPNAKVPIPIPHSQITFQPDLTASKLDAGSTQLSFDWHDVGQVIPRAASQTSGSTLTLVPAPGNIFPAALDATPVLLEDSAKDGALATGTTASDGSSISLTGMVETTAPLSTPLNVLFNLLSVSRGKTVTSEALGSGDATVAGQDFVLQKSPVTYISGDSVSGDGYGSTVHLFVNNVEWSEVRSFYGQPPGAQVFVLREDENGKTHVQFGDGINGSRLPSGVNNVTATYRYGSGAAVPASGALTTLTKPVPNLSAVRNPVPPTGGADPDSPSRIRTLAPNSVLTFGRAVSADDYTTIAAQAPGVARARAYWSFDSARQRTVVVVYVGDTPGAVTAAQKALAGAADPNRPVQVLLASPIRILLHVSIRRDPRFAPDPVQEAVTAALVDPDTGLFGLNRVRIGETVFRSQIYDACLRVPGVLAVHDLFFVRQVAHILLNETGARHSPGEGGFFQLSDNDLGVSMEAADA
ncbi:MAG TPA: baseplate J/gp47 family protein [Bryobacteraceae bacterium]|nr:baseplate J/gp47 family protein [Bryobacteraceae bacterium]